MRRKETSNGETTCISEKMNEDEKLLSENCEPDGGPMSQKG